MSKRSPAPKMASDEGLEAVADSGSSLRSGTLSRGLAIMDVLIPAGRALSLAEIAGEVDLDQSTTLRLLRALEEARQLIRVGDGKRYLASPKAMRPLPLMHPLEQLRREADPIIRELAAKVSKTVVLVAYLATERVVVDIMQSAGSLSPYYSNWLQGPLHASGPGKALLLAMGPARRKALLGAAPYATYTSSTITSEAALQADLELAAARGYSLVRDEFYDGLSALSANFHSWDRRAVGCIALTGHSADFSDEAVDQMAAELLACARLMPLQVSSLNLLDQLSEAY